jgi:spore coat protein U-like protein
MRKLRSVTRILVPASALALIVGPISANETAQMTVQAVVAPACQLTAIEVLDFGLLDQAAVNDAQADITWVCTAGHATTIELDGGGSGNILARTMSGSLPYQLYTDAGRSQVFGDGTNGSVVAVNGAGYASPATVTVYGRVTQADAAAASGGNYNDTINVTIFF